MARRPGSLGERTAAVNDRLAALELMESGLADGPAETRQAREGEFQQAKSEALEALRELLRQSLIWIAVRAIPELKNQLPDDADLAAIRETFARVRPDWEIPPGSDFRTFAAIAKLLGNEQTQVRREARAAGTKIPDQIPQQTSYGMRSATIALADGPSGRRWENIPGEVALRHVIPDTSVETKLVTGSVLDWWGRPSTHDSLREELSRGGVRVALLLNVVLDLGLRDSRVTVDLDDLIRAIGWGDVARRSVESRRECRLQMWRWLTLIESLRIIGKCPGKYYDRLTKTLINEVEIDRLIHLTKIKGPEQMALDGSEPPRAVRFQLGEILEERRGNRQFLTDFGDIRKIASISSGQPSGAWAQSIGLALNQRWREMSAKAKVGHVGDDKKLTVHFHKLLTRRELLDMYRAEPHFEDVLGSPNPRRVRGYWDDAIRKLKRAGVIGHYKETGEPVTGRQNWQEIWLGQELDIRPKDATAIAEIARSAANARRHRGKKGGSDAKK